ncbi:MAG: putative inorganic carbon (HCO3(-)) transporter [Desulforhopalus sp.]|jgi:putative inorganic carbon (HCO3(-)) transporter
MHDKAFLLYLLFVVSWFTHLAGRIPALGIIRFDFVLVVILMILAIFRSTEETPEETDVGKYLKLILVYAIVTLPFVEWPGSVLRIGLIQFIKAIVFYFFTIKFVRNEGQMKLFITVFLGSQIFRILEPLYLHVTQGYWGSAASMADWQFMNRLSGAPHDIVNPNGLAFIIVSILPFIYYYAKLNKKVFLISLFLIPVMTWTLILTASRSGFVALLAIIGLIVMKTKRKFLFVLVVILCVFAGYPFLSANQKDRYFSIVSKDTQNAATSAGRIEGVKKSLQVALHRPMFGHGLGTSKEASWNYGQSTHLAHNLYAEVAQELGFIGLLFFLIYIYSIFKELKKANIQWHPDENQDSNFIQVSYCALWIFFFMNLVFSLASYGLSGYEWYLMPALIVVLRRIQTCDVELVEKNINGKIS